MIVFHSGAEAINTSLMKKYFSGMHIMSSYFKTSKGQKPKTLIRHYKLNKKRKCKNENQS